MSRSADLVGRVLSGRYRLIAPIGAGASAQVFLADDVRLKRRVAVKLLHAALADDDTFLRRFRAEAQAAAALNHPNIVAVYDWGDDDGSSYIVTEYLAGGSLRTVLDQGTRLTPSQALLIGLETSRALDYAHRRGFVHRDIKPANLLFGEDGRLRIADFGLARALAEAAWTEPQGAVLGTARYASPEQAQGEPVDGRADVYSLGLVLIEAVTGTVPFAADTTIATLMARVGRQVEVPEALGPLRRALERAGRPSPADRADASSFGASLMALAEELPRPAPLPLGAAPTVTLDSVGAAHDDTLHGNEGPAPEPIDVDLDWDDDADDDRPRRRWPWAILAVLLLAGGVAGGALLYDRTSTPSHPVPLLVDLTREQAEAAVSEFDFELQYDEIRKDGTEAGKILETDPPAREELKEGGTIRVVVSLGNTLADIPVDLAGKSIDEATQALLAAGEFVAVPTPVQDEEVPEGTVIRLGDGVGGQAPKGSEVPLVVSAGPAPRAVPGGLKGGTYEAAASALAGVQLKAQKVEEFSETVPAGQVLRLDPGEGAQAKRDSTVKVIVSKGPDLVKVPSVNGKSADEAAAIIRGAGLVPGEVHGRAGGKAFDTDPAVGTSVKRGTTVDVFVR
ncbi:MAG: protein kinase [Actinomycetota bacterium]|nr:protein kinase [Actinomycetota bacterium]